MKAPVPLTQEWGAARFPDTSLAINDPGNEHGLNGLLAVGGTLSPERLLSAYSCGIFPWYSEGDPLLWWTPSPRAVLFPKDLRVSRSLRKRIRKGEYQITFDRAFAEVIGHCSGIRGDAINDSCSQGTWITQEMKEAYIALHQLGFAHSVESWFEGELVGGLYGIALGSLFFGESMFAHRNDASKVAFVTLVQQLQLWGFPLIDCQMSSSHLTSLGAVEIPRKQFEGYLEKWNQPLESHRGRWQIDDGGVLDV